MLANAVSRFVVEPSESEPSAVAIIHADDGTEVSRLELLNGVKSAAAELSAKGVLPEQRVMICCVDSCQFLYWFWGAMWIGAIPVPVSTMLTEADYRFLLDDSRSVGLIYSAEFSESAGLAADEQFFLKWKCLDTDRDEGRSATSVASPYPTGETDDAFWLYTSGTTGFPKGAIHRHIDLGFCTDNYAVSVLGMNSSDSVYSVAKLFFAYGLGNAGYFPSGTGATAILNSARPIPENISRHLLRYQPTIYFGVPTSYAQLLASEIPDNTFESVRVAISAGESLPADIYRRFKERFGVEILDGLGTTELAHIAISNLPGASVAGSSGYPVDGYEISLRDQDGVEVPDGEPGALYVAGESVMVGYWNRTAKTRETLQGKFLATGDSYVRNVDGSYTSLGRSDDMLKVGGIWVSPNEVEACVLELEDILQVAVVGALDADGLTKPKAFIVLADSQVGDEIEALVQNHVKSRLASYKYPRWVKVVEELPQTATGKVKRYILRNDDDQN